MRGRHCAVVSLPLIAGQARARYDAVSLQGTPPVADMAPVVNYADQLKRPRPDSAAPKPRKRPMPGSVATTATKSSKPPEPMAIARMIKMIAGAGGGR